MKRHVGGICLGLVAAVSFATTTSNLEAEQTLTRRDDPLTMSTSALRTAFPDEFAFVQQAHQLTDDAAAAALRLTWAAGSARQWAMTYLPDYAGTWVDYDRAEVVVGVAGGLREQWAAQRLVTNAMRSLGIAPSVLAMPQSFQDLVDDAALVDEAADPTNTGALQVSIDERNGRLDVVGMSAEQAKASSEVQRVVTRAGYPEIDFEAGILADPADVTGGFDGRPTIGCTVAFAVVNPANQRALLTAGHCNDTVLKSGSVTTSIAQFQRSFWPWLGGEADSGYDRQLHVLPAGTSTIAQLQAPEVQISGTFLPAQGSVICRYGAASVAMGQPAVFCSTVTGYGYDGFIAMATGCIYGDSGGPSWVMGKAVGIAAVTTDPKWPVDSSSTCWEAPVKDQLNGTGFYVQDISYGYGDDFSNIGLFHPVGPRRILDTRSTGRVNGVTEISLDTALAYSDLGSVVLSVTVVPHGAAGSATVFPGDDGLVPATINVSYGPISAESNLVVSRVNRYTKRVKVFTTQTVDLVVDVLGYLSDTSGTRGASGGVRAVSMTAARVYDSRNFGVIGPRMSRDVQVRGIGGVPATATAVIVNLTVTQPTGSGYLSVHAGGTAAPDTSNINFTIGQSKARLAIVPLDALGRLRVSAGGSSAEHFIIDVQGYFEPATSTNVGRTFALEGGGGRLVDTTAGQPLTVGVPMCIDVYAGRTEAGSGLPRDGVKGVWLSVTNSGAAGNGFLVVSARGTSTPTSTLNFVAGETRTNSVFAAVPTTTDGMVCVATFSRNTHVVIDVLAMTMA